MRMFAIIDKYNEGFYYNFEKEEFDMVLSEKCLLPTLELAMEFIEDILSEDNEAITVDIESYKPNGVMVYVTNENEFFDDGGSDV